MSDEIKMSGLTHSVEIGALALALAEAHKAFKPLKKETINPFFKSKYADLAGVIEATDEGLSKNGLAIVQSPMMNGTSITVTTMLVHSSNQWMRADLTLPTDKATAQGAGSAITYARRYSYQAFVSVAADVDDDGNQASGKDKGVVDGAAYEEEFDKRTEGQRVVGDYQIRAWEAAIPRGCRSQNQIAAYFKKIGISSIEHMHRQDFNEAIKWLLNPKVEADLTETLKESVEVAKTNGGAKKPVHNFPKLFAQAREKGVPEADVKQYAHETFKVETLNDLTPFQFKELQEWVGMMA